MPRGRRALSRDIGERAGLGDGERRDRHGGVELAGRFAPDLDIGELQRRQFRVWGNVNHWRHVAAAQDVGDGGRHLGHAVQHAHIGVLRGKLLGE